MPKPKSKFKRRPGRGDDRGMLSQDEMNNEKFEAYYKAQNILSSDDWTPFLSALRTPLPTTFRVSSSARSLNRIIEETDIDPKPTRLQWFPSEEQGGAALWQFDIARKQIRKTESYKTFRNFLIYETDSGNISRQESVSMLPPLFLDLRPGLRVMDMCAAPGSKTAQIIEALGGEGICVANDSDYKRCGLLIHQSARLPSPALLVTNLDASMYPGIRLAGENHNLRFDRILCDVPCSGDGTLRKNIAIWKKWNIAEANGVHTLQFNILRRAMNMLHSSPDARIVYSTCSFNPVENEAVVAAALLTHREFELVDCSGMFPLLQRRPGLTTWTPQGRSGTLYSSYASCLEAGKDNTKMVETMWPPKNDELHLERCMRFYPHLQDTGGFFVAVLQRRASTAPVQPPVLEQSSSAQKRPAEEAVEDGDTAHETKKQKLSTPEAIDGPIAPFSENPYTLLPPSHPLIVALTQSLELLPSFPASNLLTRNPSGESIRTVYYVNDVVKKVIEGNDYKKLRIHSAGVKVFTRHQSSSSGNDWIFRISYEGIDRLIPYIPPSKIITITKSDLRILMESFFPLCSTFEEPLKEIVTSARFGNLVMKFVAADAEEEVMYLPCWKSHTSVCLMVDKKSKTALSLRLFGSDVTPLKGPGPQNAQKQPDAQQEADVVVAPEEVEADVEAEREEDVDMQV